VDTGGSSRDCHVEPIVDEDAGRRASGERHHVTHQRHQVTSGQIWFANLHHVDPCLDRVTGLSEKPP
jgi:hypothetical protein